MEIKQFEREMLEEIVELWNTSVVPYSIFSPFTKESFENKFLKNPHYKNEGMLVAVKDNKIVGFGNATYNNNNLAAYKTPGYITCVAVDKNYWRQGIGTEILFELEKYLKSVGKTYVRNLFYNPILLEWYVPGYDKHEHPGAPAVPVNSPYYFLLANNGYIVNGQQDSYHLNLETYELPEKVKENLKTNAIDGYTITYYDPNVHYGFDELFDALKNEGWRSVVKNNLAKEKPDPLLIAQKDGEILGWTGPVYTQPSGRAYLGGIGIHPKAQGRGLGKSLFSVLCDESKKNNAKFMTLFTGSENPARNIYFYAGMKLVQSFLVLRKDLKTMPLKQIKKGAKVGIITPASTINTEDKRIKTLEERLTKLGLTYKYGKSIGERYGYLGGEDEIRAEDVNEMFADKEVDVILAMLGGYGCSRIVDNLNYDLIKTNPKPLIGFSDITVLLNAINQKTKIPTVHGPVGIYIGKDEFDDFSYEDFSKILFEKQKGRVLKNPKNDAVTINGGITRGKLVGGNLTLINNLIGTPYEIDFTDKIVFIEEVNEKPHAIDRYLVSLKLSKSIEKAKGFVLGYFTNCDIADENYKGWNHLEVLKQYFASLNKPVIYNFASGHDLPFISLPIGLEVELDADKQTITIMEEMYEAD